MVRKEGIAQDCRAAGNERRTLPFGPTMPATKTASCPLCGYDLAGHLRTARGRLVVCSECGRSTSISAIANQIVERRRNLRGAFLDAAIALAILGLIVVATLLIDGLPRPADVLRRLEWLTTGAGAAVLLAGSFLAWLAAGRVMAWQSLPVRVVCVVGFVGALALLPLPWSALLAIAWIAGHAVRQPAITR